MRLHDSCGIRTIHCTHVHEVCGFEQLEEAKWGTASILDEVAHIGTWPTSPAWKSKVRALASAANTGVRPCPET